MSKIIDAYLAGIIDGEGSVMIRKSTYRMRNPKYKDCKNPQYSVRVGIKMATPVVLDLLKDKFGGHIHKEKRIYQSKNSFKSNKIMYCYNAEHKLAENILRTLLPYLHLKQEQAKLALQVIEIKKQYGRKRQSNGKFHGQPYSHNLINKLEKLYQENKELKKR